MLGKILCDVAWSQSDEQFLFEDMLSKDIAGFVVARPNFWRCLYFSVRPLKKSWKNISNLSGGEKTLSSLALVFALHHYKPTPFYFMDEIDAALDFKNVSIISTYIQVCNFEPKMVNTSSLPVLIVICVVVANLRCSVHHNLTKKSDV